MGEDEDNKTNPSTKEADSVITEEKIDKILDWLENNGVKEGLPSAIQE